jgi:hypothetical protein
MGRTAEAPDYPCGAASAASGPEPPDHHHAIDALGGLRLILVIADPESFLKLVVIDTSGAVLAREQLPCCRGGPSKGACRRIGVADAIRSLLSNEASAR